VKVWFRAAARWIIAIACGLVAFWIVCLLIYIAIILFVFSAAIAAVRGVLQ
jgi:hypothetical protein